MANLGVEKEQRIGGEGSQERERGRWRHWEESSFCFCTLQKGGLLKFCSRNEQIQIGGNSFLGSLLSGSLGTGS